MNQNLGARLRADGASTRRRHESAGEASFDVDLQAERFIAPFLHRARTWHAVYTNVLTKDGKYGVLITYTHISAMPAPSLQSPEWLVAVLRLQLVFLRRRLSCSRMSSLHDDHNLQY